MTTSTPRDQAISLRERWQTDGLTGDGVWPTALWEGLCAAGVTRWTIAAEYGGDGLAPVELLIGAIELARGQLLPTFILSQFQAACQRLAAATNPALKQRWLPSLAAGRMFATVGISHLTTSRQHTGHLAVAATPDGGGYRLTGEIPWVTGGGRADVLVVGGAVPDGRQVLTAIPRDRGGVACSEPLIFAALSGSETCSITLTDVAVAADELIAGPMERIVQQVGGGGTGSLMTSALGLGHAQGCIDHLAREASQRPDLEPPVSAFRSEADELQRQLIAAAAGQSSGPATSPETFRTQSTDLALRASQGLLTAAKGAGFLRGHPAERLAREALFFLVWSCPQGVAAQLLQNFGRCESGF